jgi:DNA-cytosine methyltransferase
MTDARPEAWSLFSGIGGFDLGFERAGFNVTVQCEADDWRRRILARWFPRASLYPDVTTFDRAGRPTVLFGGFPCQDLSVAGRRRGLAGARSSLFFEFARIADAVVGAGGWIVLENVPGLLSSPGAATGDGGDGIDRTGRDFAIVLATLADIGFHDLAWRVLDSRYTGVPQRRRRLYIVGRRARGDRARAVLLEPEGRRWNPEPGRSAGEIPAGGVARSVSRVGGGDDYGANKGTLIPEVAGTVESHHHRIDVESAGGRLIPDHAHALARRNFKGGDPTMDTYVPVEAATMSGGGHPNSAAPGRRKEDDVNLVTFAKLHGAASSTDDETWAESEVARTLNGHEGGPARAATAVAYNVHPESGQGADLKANETDTAAPLTRTDSEQTDRGTRVVAFEARIARNGRGGPEDVVPPLKAQSGETGKGDSAPMIAGPSVGVRRLTPTECERLQGFPDGWTEIDGPGVFEPSDNEARPWKRTAGTPDGRRYQALGDAVTVNASEWLAHRLMKEIRGG